MRQDAETTDERLADDLRVALRRLTTPVAVVTTLDDDRPWGMTVSAFTTICLDPPTMAVCVNRATATAAHIEATGRLGLNVLNYDQVELSQRCAAPGESKYLAPADVIDAPERPGGHRPTPLLTDAVVAFDCDAETIEVAGTHLLIAAAVRSIRTDSPTDPLLYGNGAYLRPCPLVPVPAH